MTCVYVGWNGDEIVAGHLEEGGAVEVLREITHGRFPPPGDNYPPGFVTRIVPLKISGTGPWGLA